MNTRVTDRNRCLFAWLVLALFTPQALAETLTRALSWDHVTLNVNQQPLAADNQVTEYRVRCGKNRLPTEADAYQVIPPTVTDGRAAGVATVEVAPSADPYTLNWTVQAVTAQGLESALSVPVSESVIVPMPPQPPGIPANLIVAPVP